MYRPYTYLWCWLVREICMQQIDANGTRPCFYSCHHSKCGAICVSFFPCLETKDIVFQLSCAQLRTLRCRNERIIIIIIIFLPWYFIPRVLKLANAKMYVIIIFKPTITVSHRSLWGRRVASYRDETPMYLTAFL